MQSSLLLVDEYRTMTKGQCRQLPIVYTVEELLSALMHEQK